MLETLDYTIRIGSTPTFLYFDLYLYSAYSAHYVYNNIIYFFTKFSKSTKEWDWEYANTKLTIKLTLKLTLKTPKPNLSKKAKRAQNVVVSVW